MKLKLRLASCVSLLVVLFATQALAADFKYYPRYPQRNSVVAGHGMVTATSPLATQVGMTVLKNGGNAFDAAVATALMLNAVDPSMCGPMGAAFFVVYNAKEKKVYTLDAGSMTPLGFKADMYKSNGKEDRDKMLEGALSWTIGGTLAGYDALLTRFGTKKFGEMAEPAIFYLENGFYLTEHSHNAWTNGFPDVPLLFPNLAKTYAPDGVWPPTGALIKNPDMARSYRTVAKEGIKAVYSKNGSLAKEMVRYVQEEGGYWTLDDFEAYKVQWKEPLKMTYKGYEVFGHQPPASSMTWMQMLKMAELVDWSKYELHSAEYVNMMTEIERLAHADSYQWGGDPMYANAPGQLTLDENYVKSQLARIQPGKAAPGKVAPATPTR